MTCVVGLEQGGVVYIGADSAGVDINSLEICGRADEKAFLHDAGEVVMGFCGSFRVGQLLRYGLAMPDQPSKKDDMAYLVTDFIDGVRSLMLSKGAMTKENELEEQNAGFLVGYNGHLYVVESDFQVGRPIMNYASIGCGAQLALGAMYATRNLDMTPHDRITLALQAACEFSAGVRAPFHIVKLQQEKEE